MYLRRRANSHDLFFSRLLSALGRISDNTKFQNNEVQADASTKTIQGRTQKEEEKKVKSPLKVFLRDFAL